jgi:hypothetical protein
VTVPRQTEEPVRDAEGRPLRPGDAVRVEGMAEQAEVQAVDPRYGVVVVLVPARAGKMGRMVRGADVRRIQ